MGKASRTKDPRATGATSRQAKIEAVRKDTGRGVSRIVTAGVVVLVAIIATVAGVIWSNRPPTSAAGGSSVPAGTAMGEGFRAYSSVSLEPGAPTVDIYEDFQCPACANFEKSLGGTLEELAQSGRIRLVYHVKTFLDDNLRNDSSTRAGNGAFCAAQFGKFSEFHNQVYANQPQREGEGWTDAQLRGFAQSAGLGGDQLATWESCTANGRYDKYLAAVEETTARDGVTSTPTIKIDGKTTPWQSIATPDALRKAVKDATA